MYPNPHHLSVGVGLLLDGLVSQVPEVVGRKPRKDGDTAGQLGEHDEGDGRATGENQAASVSGGGGGGEGSVDVAQLR